jgi:hypothetical protein
MIDCNFKLNKYQLSQIFSKDAAHFLGIIFMANVAAIGLMAFLCGATIEYFYEIILFSCLMPLAAVFDISIKIREFYKGRQCDQSTI